MFDLHSVSSFGSGTVFGSGTTFSPAQDFSSGVQDFSAGVMDFKPGTKFASGQTFSENQTFTQKSIEYGAGSNFTAAETFGEAADFSAGIQPLVGVNTFEKDSKFAASQTFAVPQTFGGGTTFGAAMEFAPSQNFANDFTTAGTMELDVAANGLTNWFDIMALITTVDTTGANTDVTPGDVTVITALSSKSYTTANIIYADFSAVTSGSQINDVLFTDYDLDGKIDCTGTGPTQCELADLPSPVTFADGATVVFDYYATHTFGSGTVFGAGAEFSKGQIFTTTQDFSAGDMVFPPGMTFANGQDFDNGSVDYDFNKKAIEYGSNTDFKANETFGEGAVFDAGVQLFDGANTFAKDTKFAASQTFAVPQTFAGANTFGAAMAFAAAQNFASDLTTAGNMELDVAANGLTNWFDIMALITTVDTTGANTDVTPGDVTVITALSSKSYTTANIIYADFSAVTSGSQINDVLFTDYDLDGKIDCTGTGPTQCELADLPSPVTFADGATVVFDLHSVQAFGAGTVFGSGTTFSPAQAFTSVQNFSSGSQTFGVGTVFNGDTNFNPAQVFTANTSFGDGQTFDAVDDKTTAFGATGIIFGTETPIVFTDNDLTFGAEATFPKNQDFSVGNANDFTASDINFKEGTMFHASETFGAHVDFEGAITFPEAIDMPTGAEFAAQTFANGATPAFDDFSTFADNTIFDDTSIVFEENTHFKGSTTFADSSTHTFKEGTVFDGALTLSANTVITYDGDSVDFGPASDLSAKVQDFAAGSTPTIPQFGAGTTFAVNQPLPTGSVLSTGILLTAITCGTDTTSETCLPTADSAILTKGEIITPGETAPPAIKNTISKDDTTISIDGLGVSVDFTSITTDGNLSVAIQDPDVTVANTNAILADDNSGALKFLASGKSITTVSSVIDFDLTGSTASSGAMTITLPYDESAATAAGFDESTLEVSHYVNNVWVVENNCTVDTANNNITCIVDTIE